MTLKTLFGRLFGRRTTPTPGDEFQPSIEWLERENPKFAQMLKEWSTSQAMIKSSAGQESETSDKFRKITLSRAFFALCLRRNDTAEACFEMIKAADQIGTGLEEEAIANLVHRAFHIVTLLSKHAGRRLPPLSGIERVTFLCDQLREVNLSAASSYLILNRRPTDSGAIECDLLCSEPGCDYIETAVLSQETVDGLDRHALVWRCSKHQGRPVDSSRNRSPKVRELWDRVRELSQGERRPTIGELLKLRREVLTLSKDVSISVADHFSLFRLTDAIDDTLDRAMNDIPSLRESPESAGCQASTRPIQRSV
jgi:hypothetical protein